MKENKITQALKSQREGEWREAGEGWREKSKGRNYDEKKEGDEEADAILFFSRCMIA